MILTAHQPAYIPWLGYFHKIALADKLVMLDSVQFEKSSFTNRNKIKTANGEAWLTIPVEMKGHLEKTILDINCDSKQFWKKKHWNSILLSYKKAPYFNLYSDFFENYYQLETNNLNEFIFISLQFFFKELNINIPILKLSELDINSNKQDLIIDLCKKTSSDAFVFGSMGKNYAQEELFNEEKISIYFQEYKHPNYNQIWGDFIPYMGIIDALFNLGPERTSEVIFENNIKKGELELLLSKNRTQ